MSEPTTHPQAATVNGPTSQPTDDVLWVGPVQMEMCKDLRWAMKQAQDGTWDEHAAKHIGIVNETVYCIDYDPVKVREETARKAGVIPARVAVYYMDDGVDR